MPEHTTDTIDSRFQRAGWADIIPGVPLLFRCGGHGPAQPVKVLPTGPRGQIMVRFTDPGMGFDLAVSPRELFKQMP